MAYSGAINLSGVSALQVFQRTTRTGGAFGAGIANVPVTISPTVAISSLKFQVRDFNNPATILVAYTAIGSNYATGTQVVNLPIPAINTTATWYLIDLMAESDVTSVVTTPQCGIGELVAVAGQSLAMNMLSPLAGGDGSVTYPLSVVPGGAISPFGVMFCQAWNGPTSQSAACTWQLPVNNISPGNVTSFNSSFTINYLNLMVATYKVPCAVVGYAVGSQDIRSFLPFYDPNNLAGTNLVGSNPWSSTSNYYTQLTTILSAAGGVFGNFIWCQGHRNALNGSTQAQYVSYLTTFFGYIVAAYPTMVFNRIIATIPSITNTYATPANCEAIRQAGLQYVQSDPLSVLVDGLDVTLNTDVVHPDQAGNVKFSNAFFRATAYKMGTLPNQARGPSITAAIRTSQTNINLIIAQDGGTSLVGTGTLSSQFTAFYSGGFSNPVAISSATIVNPNLISLTIPSGIPVGQSLDIWYRYPGDSNAGTIVNGIYDNKVDASVPSITYGRQLSLPNKANSSGAFHGCVTTSNVSSTYLKTGDGKTLSFA